MSPPPSRRRWTADPETNVRERNVENDKPNGVVAFPPLSEPLDLIGRVVTADAMHTQKKAATLVVGKKRPLRPRRQTEPAEAVGCSGRSGQLGRPRSSGVRDRTQRPRAHRPPPGLVAAGPADDHLPAREPLRHRRTRTGRPSMTSRSASRPASTSPISLPMTRASSTCSDSCTDTGPSRTASTGFET